MVDGVYFLRAFTGTKLGQADEYKQERSGVWKEHQPGPSTNLDMFIGLASILVWAV